jgi:ribosomal protein S18 acetylase RimI-like enzyme
MIRRMSSGDLPAACEVIGLAFADNPSALANVRGNRVKARRTMQGAVRIAKLGSRFSRVLVAEEDGRLVGVLNAAQWPHCLMSTAEKIRTAPAMVRTMGTALPRAFSMMSRRAKHDPPKAHWHLGPIGVHPEAQGRGIGKGLLVSFLDTVDQQASAAFLETDVDMNVALYQQFGFKVVAREEIIGIDTRFMWRESRSVVP